MNKKNNFNVTAVSISLLIAEILLLLLYVGIWISMRNINDVNIERPNILMAGLALPLLSILYLLSIYNKNKRLNTLADHHLLAQIVPDISTLKSTLRFLLLRIGLTFVVLALANPRMGLQQVDAKSEGVELMIALDISNSMMAEDITPNRLSAAKRITEKLIDKLKGDKVGIVVFAGDAYMQLPITTDHSAAKLFLNGIETNIAPMQGTAIGRAIDMCMGAFTLESPAQKTIVIITDGENHEDDALVAASKANEQNVVVHCIGMGSENGAPIPVYSQGRNMGFKKDKQDNIVLSKLNEPMLKEISQAGKGVYIRANNSIQAVAPIYSEIEKMDKATFDQTLFTDYESRYQYFLGIGLLAFLLYPMFGERKPKWVQHNPFFKA